MIVHAQVVGGCRDGEVLAIDTKIGARVRLVKTRPYPVKYNEGGLCLRDSMFVGDLQFDTYQLVLRDRWLLERKD